MLLSLRDALQQVSDPDEEADKYYDESESDSHKDRGMAYKQEGRFPEAIAEFESALETEPDDHFALSHLAHIYLLQDKPQEASRMARAVAEAGMETEEIIRRALKATVKE